MNSLSPIIRKKAELVSVVCGCAGGVLANIERSNAMVLWIVAASTFAGAVGNISADAGDDPGLRPRAGIRAGVLTAVIAGAVAVLGFTIQGIVGGFLVVVPALLAIPPGAFFGMLGSLVVSMIQNPQVRPLGPSDARERSRPSVLLIAILLGSITGYLSPLIAVSVLAAAPRLASSPTPRIAPTPTPTPTPKPTPTPIPKKAEPPPPPWRYESPAGFFEAHPSQLTVLKEVSLGAFESPFRFAFARDGERIAFVRSDSSIIVLNLNEPETTTSFFVPEAPERFDFSPDGKRLFCLTAKDGKYVLSKERAIRLPLPPGSLSGPVEWIEDNRVVIGDKSLDLDTLQLSPAPKDRISVKASSHPHIKVHIEGRLNGVQGTRFATEKRHAFADATRDYFLVSEAKGESAFLSPNGTKLLDVRNRELVVMYLKLREPRETRLTANMGAAPPASAADALKSRRLWAVVCPPIINPLNDKPVAADLSRVKAVVGVESWEGSTANLYVREDYGVNVENGDSVGLLLKTLGGRHSVVEGFENWWSLVSNVTSGAAPDRLGKAESESPTHTESPKTSPTIPEPQKAMAPDKLADLLRSFILAHHAKSSRGDVDGLVADYADRVDHLKGSVVDREVIRKEELDYHAPGTRVSETVVGEIRLSAAGENLYRANYTIRYEQVRPNGAWARGLSDIDLVIDVGRAAPRVIPQIVRQRANNRDKQKGP